MENNKHPEASWMNAELGIKTANGQSQVKVEGKHEALLFNWVMLTTTLCQELGMPPVALGLVLPKLAEDVKRLGTVGYKFDLAAMRRQTGGGGSL